MWLRKLRTISLAVLLIGGTTGSLGVWAHWPSADARPPAVRHGALPSLAPGENSTPARDAGSAPQPAKSPGRSQASGDDVRLTDCPLDCPAGECDGPPPYCPISMAANAFSMMMGYLHSSGSSR